MPFLDRIEKWAAKGSTAKEIADKLKVAYSTLRKYLDAGRAGDERYTALSAAFAQGCEVSDDNVETALYNLAQGYSVRVMRHYKVKHAEFDPITGRKIKEWEELVEREDDQHVPANVQAQMFWLANRRRDKWAYKPTEGGGEGSAEDQGVVMIPEVVKTGAETPEAPAQETVTDA